MKKHSPLWIQFVVPESLQGPINITASCGTCGHCHTRKAEYSADGIWRGLNDVKFIVQGSGCPISDGEYADAVFLNL